MENEFWNKNQKIIKRFGSIVLVLFVLVAIWWVFLKLVGSPPLDTTTSLIMVWLTFAIIIFTLFPGIVNRIKRVKIKGFEFELNEAVAKATSFDYMADLENIDFRVTRKGDFSNLVKFFLLAKNNPEKPILLLINLQDERYISIHALFLYLYFLDLINPNITCLFYKSRSRIEDWREIIESEIVGVSNGKTILQSLLKTYPDLLKLIDFSQQELFISESENIFTSDQMENAFRMMYEQHRDLKIRRSEYLTVSDIKNIIGARITKFAIDNFNNNANLKTIYNALISEIDYLLVIKDNKLYSVLPVERLAKVVSIKAIREMINDGSSAVVI